MSFKSYRGKHVGELPAEDEKISVREHMNRNVISFRTEQPITEVIQTLISKSVSGGPVINNKMEVIGIISEGDCVKQISESRYYNMPMDVTITVEKRMIRNVETVSPDINIFDAANKFLTLKKRRFPVCENKKLIGIISQKDILKAVLKLKGFK